jgi:deoxyhypusine synthase
VKKSRKFVEVSRVDEVETLHDVFTKCMPAFGGAYLRRTYAILDRAIGAGCPLTMAIAGPITVSGQHQAWLIPMIEAGWIAYLSTTDAVCYHDGHRSLQKENPVFEVPIFTDDGALRDDKVIRVTDMAFDEKVLFDEDQFISAILMRPEFQKKMTGTELRYRVGQIYGECEKKLKVQTGLLATCHKFAVPILVGAPGDGSLFLNSMKLWAMKQAGIIPEYKFELDLHHEVLESCAYHYWGLFENPTKTLATLILGGGVPKNYNLQPEPALSQVLGLNDISGYQFDVQIVSAPVTEGSLSSCPPAEAVTWGKVDRTTYESDTESMQADYSMIMPFIVKALLDNRKKYQAMAKEMGEKKLFQKEPKAKGYLRPAEGYRLYDARERLTGKLFDELKKNREWLLKTMKYPL